MKFVDEAVIDIAAGNGVSGEALAAQGLHPVLGTDIVPAAREATLRDRPALYDEYLATLAQLPAPDRSRQRAREKVADEQKRALAPHVPRLVIRIAVSADVNIRRDDVTLRPAAVGMPLPVDPGEHEITFRVGGGAPGGLPGPSG